MGTRTLVAGALLSLLLSEAFAQESNPPPGARVITAVRIPDGESVRIDGVLDETVWRTAIPAADFVQRDPDNGAPATERTEVRVLYDSDRLIIGATLDDSEPDRVLGNQMQRDQSFDADDRFLWTIDTYLDGRSGYYFEINPAGAMGDGLIDPSEGGGFSGLGAGINRSWDGIWLARVRRTPSGWTAEIEIPFGTLNFDPGGQTWGINFQRTIRRKNEHTLWAGHLRNQGLARMSNAGRVAGLTGLSQGVGLDVKPYAVGTFASASGRGEPSVSSADAGLDVFYNVTPALRATLSLNTDFAETEVDVRQVNLTRFPLFFEEKRDFFLQGAGYFDFSQDPGQAITPFFSRRIGLDERGIPQRIDVGAKLTGQAGPLDIGVLQVRTAEGPEAPGEDFSVVRVRGRVFQESYIGGMYTRRAARSGAPDAHTAGADVLLRTSAFRGGENLELSAFYVRTSDPLDRADTAAYGATARYPNDPLRAGLSFRELQPNYDPAAGFLQRVGYRRLNPDIGYFWRPDAHPWFREFDFQADLTVITDLEGRQLTRELELRPFDVNFHDGGRFSIEVVPQYERLEEDFEISPGVVLPQGREYEFTRYQIEGSTARHRAVAVSASVGLGGFFSGRRREYVAGIGVRPRRGVAVAVEAEHNVLDLAEGRFDTDVLRARASTQFSPWISVVNDLQYDSVTRLIGWQTRFRWIQRPGNDLFFVYSHNWQELQEPDRRRFATLDQRAASKLVYTLRF